MVDEQMKLEKFGWNSFFADSFRSYRDAGYIAGRVYLEHRGGYWLYTEQGELKAEVSGRMRHQACERQDLPAVGDWVVIRAQEPERRATIHTVLPRKSKFSRKAAGSRTEEQVIAANVDTAMLVTALDHDFNLRRIERYLIMAQGSGAETVIVLNKADLCENVEQRIEEVKAVAFSVPVVCISATQDEGLSALLPFVKEGETVAFLGSSGAGKSTIINRLLGREAQRVQAVRASDSRGRHTTTHRELIVLPGGGLLMDTPGMRELQLWVGDEAVHSAFADIESLIAQCYFSNCHHRDEPGCAIKQALEDERLDVARFNNYEKLQKELAYLAEKQDLRAASVKKEEVKRLTRSYNKNQKRW